MNNSKNQKSSGRKPYKLERIVHGSGPSPGGPGSARGIHVPMVEYVPALEESNRNAENISLIRE